ncbi:MAG: hypothetical protein ACLP7F_01010, partial [Acidimicrobiales bacterium]
MSSRPTVATAVTGTSLTASSGWASAVGGGHGGRLGHPEASRPKPSAQVYNRGGAVDLVPVVRLKAPLRQMYEIDGRDHAQCNS